MHYWGKHTLSGLDSSSTIDVISDARALGIRAVTNNNILLRQCSVVSHDLSTPAAILWSERRVLMIINVVSYSEGSDFNFALIISSSLS